MPEPPRDGDPKSYLIEVQESFAPKFDAWYRDLSEDPYRSTFTYGRLKAERFIDAALDQMPAGSRFLDVGCGTGFHLARLRERGFDVLGVEPGEELRRRAQANNPDVSVVDGDIEALRFDDGSFDGVLAIEVIRHVPDPQRAVNEVARVLRPGGMAITTVPPRWSANGYALINQVTSRVRVPTFTHAKQHFFSQPGARRLMRSAGFATVEMHGVLLGPWPVVGRLSPTLLSKLLRAFEPIDDSVSDRPLVRGLTSQLVLIGRK